MTRTTMLALLLAISSLALAEDADSRAVDLVNKARGLNEGPTAGQSLKVLQSAIEKYQADRKAKPDDALIALGLARLQFELQQDDAATESLAAAIRLQPKNAAMRAFKALTLFQTNKPEEADREYRLALELDPKNAQWKVDYARFLFSSKRDAEGKTQAQEAIHLDPRNKEAILLWAALLLQEGKREESLQTMKTAVALSPKDLELREAYAFGLWGSDKREEAYAQFVEITKLDSQHFGAVTSLLRFATVLKKTKEAEQHLARVYELQKAGHADADSFVREEFIVEKRTVIAEEHFELKGARALKYVFHIMDEQGAEDYRVSLGSYDFSTQFARSSGTIKPTERMYHLDYYRGREHRTYGFFPATPPTYEATRAKALSIIEGKLRPLSSSVLPERPMAVEKKPKE